MQVKKSKFSEKTKITNKNNIKKNSTIKNEDIKDGIELGRDEGREEERIRIAAEMKKLKIETEKIVKATGLSKNQVEKL